MRRASDAILRAFSLASQPTTRRGCYRLPSHFSTKDLLHNNGYLATRSVVYNTSTPPMWRRLQLRRGIKCCRTCSFGRVRGYNGSSSTRKGETTTRDENKNKKKSPPTSAQGQKIMQRGELHHVFDLVDSDNDGMITLEELGTLMEYLDLRHSREEVREIGRMLSKREDGLIAEEEFVSLISKNSPNQRYQREQSLREQQAALMMEEGKDGAATNRMGSLKWMRRKWQLLRDELRLYVQGLQMLLRQLFLLNKMVLNLFNPLGHSFLRLDVRERNRMWRTTVDVLRFAPFCLLVIAPGGGVLVAMLAKKFPSLLPSSFRPNSEVRGEEDVYEAIQALAADVRRKKDLQDRADVLFGNFVGELVAARERFWPVGLGALPLPMQERMQLASKHASLVSFGGRVAIDTEALCDNLTKAQLNALCKVAHIPPRVSRTKLRPRLKTLLSELKLRDEELARGVGGGIASLDAKELALLCSQRGIASGAPNSKAHMNSKDVSTPKPTVQEQLNDLQTWVSVTAGGDDDGKRNATSPLFALMCQVPNFPDYERKQNRGSTNW
eukprot:CAMPEP_0195529398 /NCGR_PEP_ID=MMETSP0794_2-20130614/31906_1 /TAXON_ID=515487 /ORGANISM="Stephanopyxis turris, Strain CCMP 815" /LENGTH=553 /DNA_ID=CAMNT_0040660695 /DNA_START=113 /DNA_END=1771 /DNA_ORIENTATION=-